MAVRQAESDEEFARRVGDIPNQGFVAIGLALGEELGLWDVMAKFDRPASHREIAEAAGMKPRWITSCVKSHDQLTKCFPMDGPKGFAPSGHLDDMLAMGKKMWIQDLITFDKFLDQTPGLKDKLGNGISVCECGCSSGQVLIFLASRFPKSNFHGFDLSDAGISKAKAKIKELNLTNIKFSVCDIYKLPSDWLERWDYVFTEDVIHDLPHPAEGVRSLARIIKPGGYLSVVDLPMKSSLNRNISMGGSNQLYTLSLYHCMPYSLHFGGQGSGTGYGIDRIEQEVKDAGLSVKCVESVPGVGLLHIVALKQ